MNHYKCFFVLFFFLLYNFSLLSFLFMTFILSLSLSVTTTIHGLVTVKMVVSVCGSGPRFFIKHLLSLSILLVFVVFGGGGGGGFPQNISFGSLSFCGFWFFRVWACDFVVLCVCGCALLWIFFTKRLKSERDGRKRKKNG